MSVEMWDVTEMSSAEGTAASAIQRSAWRQDRRGFAHCVCSRCLGGKRRAQHQPSAPCDQRDQHEEQHGPAKCLLAECAERLQHERIGKEREKTADVARRIEKIRVRGRRMIGTREPRLQQRAVGRQREERQADRYGKQAEQPQRCGGVSRRTSPPRRDRERQEQRGHRHHHEMHDDRALARQIAGQRMGVGIACQQHCLEEHHRDRPHRRRSAELRQHHLGEHRLHGEQERGREEDRGAVDAQQGGRAGRHFAVLVLGSKRPEERCGRPCAGSNTAPQHNGQSCPIPDYPLGRSVLQFQAPRGGAENIAHKRMISRRYTCGTAFAPNAPPFWSRRRSQCADAISPSLPLRAEPRQLLPLRSCTRRPPSTGK